MQSSVSQKIQLNVWEYCRKQVHWRKVNPDLIVLSDDFEKNPDSLQKVDTVINKGEIVKENQIPLI